MDRQDCVDLLTMWGTLTKAEFVKDADTGVRCGGFIFELDLHENKRLPNRIKVLSDVIVVTTKDDHKLCSYCDKLGHIRRHCKKRELDLINQANAELLESQQSGPIGDQEMMDTSEEERKRHEEELQQQQRSPAPTTITAPTTLTAPSTATAPTTLTAPSTSTAPTTLTAPSISTAPMTPTKRSTSENGHPSESTWTKRQSVTIFEEVDEETYTSYAEKRKDCANQARREIAAHHFPDRFPSQLSEKEWAGIQTQINARFRELLVTAFPDNHLFLNCMYMNRKAP